MGLTKRWMEDREAKREEATEIAVEAGSLERCEIHRDYVRDTGDTTMAYRLANTWFTTGELREDYASRRELTDVIKDVIEDSGIDSCPSCECF